MIDPESVETRIVRDALYVYREFWASRYWPEKTVQLQAAVDASGLSIPVPVIDIGAAKLDFPQGNPLDLDKPFFKLITCKSDPDGQARKIAQALYRAGLPTFYCDNSQLIDLTMAQRGAEVDDLALYAPVLVYCHNFDRRGDDISRAKSRLYSRRHGICYLIEQEGL
jgi:hypothetical protein